MLISFQATTATNAPRHNKTDPTSPDPHEVNNSTTRSSRPKSQLWRLSRKLRRSEEAMIANIAVIMLTSTCSENSNPTPIHQNPPNEAAPLTPRNATRPNEDAPPPRTLSPQAQPTDPSPAHHHRENDDLAALDHLGPRAQNEATPALPTLSHGRTGLATTRHQQEETPEIEARPARYQHRRKDGDRQITHEGGKSTLDRDQGQDPPTEADESQIETLEENPPPDPPHQHQQYEKNAA
ncbi:hypothetical protein M409DRAFT_54521 [Zasmidium cellare ATCC 36951]|uniref:Uncharacterized protein n=1 Tax=Zasmidium cellare ATCC 36951 TaxID=1080233 RepID=A0A6A6CKP4_ZASCE|nr:uncharacterized protein M409DRAFT_54521 [Zasmidium cellare ATCC 36951]KAF2166730.1 hypothetical protein M409DRAFT_54521 [Zasmidium cellare ATCC 36951]